ncbi:hypothetical protein [Streptomyces sp. NPDC090445]|uniref:hypothetical protein n=1 Tax=Streptomyces sp. NPDC090445 TaxID=3365963 RepID=UPI00382F5EC4
MNDPVAPAGSPSRHSRQSPPSRPLRRALRRPVAATLMACGVLHLPGDPTAVPSAGPAGLLPLLAALLCLGLGAALGIRDGDAVWRAGAAAALGVVTLHVAGGVGGYDPLSGAVSASLAWAGAAAVLCAAVAALLAGLALVNRSPGAGAGAGG